MCKVTFEKCHMPHWRWHFDLNFSSAPPASPIGRWDLEDPIFLQTTYATRCLYTTCAMLLTSSLSFVGIGVPTMKDADVRYPRRIDEKTSSIQVGAVVRTTAGGRLRSCSWLRT